MPAPFTVVAADFLEDPSIEVPILQDIAKMVLALATDEETLAQFAPQADAFLLFHDLSKLGEKTFARAPKCKIVVRAGVGYNNVDLDAANRHGIIVCNVPDYGTEEVADHALMMLLAIARRLIPSHAAIRSGTWHYATAVGTPRMRGRTLGIVGCGNIGSAMALRAKALGLDVVFFDPFAKRGHDKALGIRRANTLDDLLGQSHFVSLHCYLDPGTYHLINAEAFRKMRPGAYLINTARGGVVDTDALRDALESGHLAGAAIDVLEREPLDDERLRAHPNVIFTPHSAFYSVEGFEEMRSKAAHEIRRVLLGEAPWCQVNNPVAVSRG
jgi:C-terminal binding protein